MPGDFRKIDYSLYVNLQTIQVSMEYITETVSEDEPLGKLYFDVDATQCAWSVKRLMREVRDTELAKKIANGLRMVLVFSYEWDWLMGSKREKIVATIDCTDDTPVVLKKETIKSGE